MRRASTGSNTEQASAGATGLPLQSEALLGWSLSGHGLSTSGPGLMSWPPGLRAREWNLQESLNCSLLPSLAGQDKGGGHRCLDQADTKQTADPHTSPNLEASY